MANEPISDQERRAREWQVRQTRHSTEMEGGRTDDEFRAEQDRYVRGEITADDLVAWVLARHPRPPLTAPGSNGRGGVDGADDAGRVDG